MRHSKAIDRVCCVAAAVMLILTAVIWTGKAGAGRQNQIEVGYEGLFDASVVHVIDIEMADWDGFIQNATSEEYAECAVTIDGEKIANVGIRGKGNTSLSSVAGMGSRKYSFKIEFDHFVKGRLYKGLDKLSLNNLIYDATMMKDYLAYTLMTRENVPAPLCSFAQITVNGEPWGLYLAVEGVEDGFLERNNMTVGELYKPDSMSFGGGRGNGQDFDFDEFRENFVQRQEDGETSEAPGEDMSALLGQAADAFAASSGQSADDFAASSGQPAGDFAPSSGQGAQGFDPPSGDAASFGGQAQAGGGAAEPEENQERRGNFSFGGFGMGSSDVKLQYTDDDPESYANIFDNAKTEIGKKDKARLIGALKTLSGESPRDAVFTDEVIQYLTVHDFLQNADSYTGSIVHNYYLYEENGRLAILPWDYNLAFGAQSMGFDGSDATALINSPIDSPVSNGSAEDRPLVAWIFQDEDALAQYHETYDRFIAETVESGWLEEEIARVAALIRPYVAADENSFYTAEEFDAAVEALQSYCALRGESIRGQLSGAIPATREGQQADGSALVDGSGVSIAAMGSMSMGFGGRGKENAPNMNPFSRREGAGPQGSGGPQNALPENGENQQTEETSSFGGSAGSSGASASPTEVPAQAGPEAPQSAVETAAPERPGEEARRVGGFPGGSAPEESSAGMPWWQLAVYALILLLAIALIARSPGHNR